MHITINNNQIEPVNGETLLETARRTGYDIPSLCYAKGAKHQSSCMVCAVKECATGQIIPSCTTLPTEGMQIDTESDEVQMVRTLSLELLLSDHRADCEAPCSMVCPQGLDIERMLNLYDNGRHEEAYAMIAAVFALPALGCDNCKVPCEKVCRRGTVDQAVSIRTVIKELVSEYRKVALQDRHCGLEPQSNPTICKSDKNLFQSRLGRFTVSEKDFLKETVTTPSGCLHCACSGREGCKLRLYATAADIKRPRYEASSALPVMQKEHVTGRMWFEQAKCIRCGLCIYNSENGFTFKDRGFGMQVVIPNENKANVGEEISELCPTGALYLIP
jgi:predicted molibdopterin-dependent oxidoreductase YjgC